MEAPKATTCELCSGAVAAGEQIWPVVRAEQRGYRWSHFACAETAGITGKRPLCKHHLRRGGRGCAYGDNCFFRHVAPEEAAQEADASLLPTPSRARTWNGKRNVVRKISRASVVRRLLLTELGLDQLRQGSGVLDVAGGNGDLAFELLNLNDTQTTCIDPRPMRLSRCDLKWRRGIYWWNRVWRPWNGIKPDPDAEWKRPQHLRLLFDVELTDWAHLALSSETRGDKDCTNKLQICSQLQGALTTARGLQWSTKGLHEGSAVEEVPGEGDSGEDDNHSEEEAQHAEVDETLTFEHALHVARVIADCSVVVGIHPDQAAGHIVDFAVAANKPFLVVPCCVYGITFPRRRLPDGRRVRTSSELVEYLISRAPGCRTQVLDFEGRNVAVYWRPEWASAEAVAAAGGAVSADVAGPCPPPPPPPPPFS